MPGTDNAQFFTRMGQRLIKVLDQPHRMASSIAWICGCVRLAKVAAGAELCGAGRLLPGARARLERYAMVKARIMGDSEGVYAKSCVRCCARLFSAVTSISASSVAAQYERDDCPRSASTRFDDNIKLGAGGIREIEFIVQVFSSFAAGANHRCNRALYCQR